MQCQGATPRRGTFPRAHLSSHAHHHRPLAPTVKAPHTRRRYALAPHPSPLAARKDFHDISQESNERRSDETASSSAPPPPPEAGDPGPGDDVLPLPARSPRRGSSRLLAASRTALVRAPLDAPRPQGCSKLHNASQDAGRSFGRSERFEKRVVRRD